MNFPVPVDQLDVTRDFETTSTFEGLSEPWTGLVRFYDLPKMLPDGKMVVRGRETRVQATTRPDQILPEHWKTLSRGQRKREKLTTQKTSNEPARHVSGLLFGCGHDRTNKLKSFAPQRLVYLHGIPWNAVLPTMWTAELSFETRTSRA
eukprot:8032474-Pyramimonas_sp.AAC.1